MIKNQFGNILFPSPEQEEQGWKDLQESIVANSIDKAMDQCNSLLSTTETNKTEINILLAICDIQKKEYSKALSKFKAALGSKNSDIILNNIALCYLGLADKKEARKFFDQALQKNPKNVKIKENFDLNFLLKKKKIADKENAPSKVKGEEETFNNSMEEKRKPFGAIDVNKKGGIVFKNPFEKQKQENKKLKESKSSGLNEDFDEISPFEEQLTVHGKLEEWRKGYDSYNNQEYKKAISIFTSCLDLSKDINTSTYSMLYHCYYNTKEYIPCFNFLNQLEKSRTLTKNELVSKACLQVNFGNLEPAVAVFNEVKTERADAFNAIAHLNYQKGSYFNALKLLNSDKFDKDDTDVLYNKALVHYSMNNFSESSNSLKGVFNKCKDIFILYALSLARKDDKDTLKKILKSSSKFITNNFSQSDVEFIGDILKKSKLYKEAIETYQRVIEKDSYDNTGRVLTKIGSCYTCLDNKAEAMKNFEKAIELCPNHTTLIKSIAVYNFKTENYTKAKELFEKVTKILPDDDSYTYLMLIAQKEGKLKEAEEFGSKAVTTNPYNMNAQNVLGLTELMQGKTKDAIDTFDFAFSFFDIATNASNFTKTYSNTKQYIVNNEGVNKFDIGVNLGAAYFDGSKIKQSEKVLKENLTVLRNNYISKNKEDIDTINHNKTKTLLNLLTLSLLNNNKEGFETAFADLEKISINKKVKKKIDSIKELFSQLNEILNENNHLSLSYKDIVLLKSCDEELENYTEQLVSDLTMLKENFDSKRDLLERQNSLANKLTELKASDGNMYKYYNHLSKLFAMYFTNANTLLTDKEQSTTKRISFKFNFTIGQVNLKPYYVNNLKSFQDLTKLIHSKISKAKDESIIENLNSLIGVQREEKSFNQFISDIYYELFNAFDDTMVVRKRCINEELTSNKLKKMPIDDFNKEKFEKHQFYALKDFVYIIKYLENNFETIKKQDIRLEKVIRDVLTREVGFVDKTKYAVSKLENGNNQNSMDNTFHCSVKCQISGKLDKKAILFGVLKAREGDSWTIIAKTRDMKFNRDISFGQFEISFKGKTDQLKIELFKVKKKTSRLSEYVFGTGEARQEEGVSFSFNKSGCFKKTKFEFRLSLQ